MKAKAHEQDPVSIKQESVILHNAESQNCINDGARGEVGFKVACRCAATVDWLKEPTMSVEGISRCGLSLKSADWLGLWLSLTLRPRCAIVCLMFISMKV